MIGGVKRHHLMIQKSDVLVRFLSLQLSTKYARKCEWNIYNIIVFNLENSNNSLCKLTFIFQSVVPFASSIFYNASIFISWPSDKRIHNTLFEGFPLYLNSLIFFSNIKCE